MFVVFISVLILQDQLSYAGKVRGGDYFQSVRECCCDPLGTELFVHCEHIDSQVSSLLELFLTSCGIFGK